MSSTAVNPLGPLHRRRLSSRCRCSVPDPVRPAAVQLILLTSRFVHGAGANQGAAVSQSLLDFGIMDHAWVLGT